MRRLLRCGKAYRAETSRHGAADAIADSVAADELNGSYIARSVFDESVAVPVAAAVRAAAGN
jgi:hypothetical protein